MKIVWKDLAKPQGFFTRRSTLMVTLDTKKAVQSYCSNTKINVVQYTVFNDTVYFRTSSAKERDLNWAIKADSFDLPNGYLASLAPIKSPAKKAASSKSSSLKLVKQKPVQQAVSSKSEGKISANKINLIKRLLSRIKKKEK